MEEELIDKLIAYKEIETKNSFKRDPNVVSVRFTTFGNIAARKALRFVLGHLDQPTKNYIFNQIKELRLTDEEIPTKN